MGERSEWSIFRYRFDLLIVSDDTIGWCQVPSSDFWIGRLCRFVLSSDSLIVRSCFLVLSSDFWIGRLCRFDLSSDSLIVRSCFLVLSSDFWQGNFLICNCSYFYALFASHHRFSLKTTPRIIDSLLIYNKLQNLICQKVIKLFEPNFQRGFLYTYTARSGNLSSLALS